ncbi:MAG: hypothetical protein MRY63_05355 [Neomegalonema sp.]|nr:hypothetical protein [Neomegalonema sp.]
MVEMMGTLMLLAAFAAMGVLFFWFVLYSDGNWGRGLFAMRPPEEGMIVDGQRRPQIPIEEDEEKKLKARPWRLPALAKPKIRLSPLTEEKIDAMLADGTVRLGVAARMRARLRARLKRRERQLRAMKQRQSGGLRR